MHQLPPTNEQGGRHSCLPSAKGPIKRVFKLARLLPGLALIAGAAVVLYPNLSATADEPAPANATAQTTTTAPTPAIDYKPGDLEVYPAQIDLTTNADAQSVVVRTRRADGVTIDLTGKATLSVEDSNIAEVKGGALYPKADGGTTLIVKHEGKTARVPVTVAKAGEERPASFRLDVLPIFAKSGCNNGACHGSARGQDGFNLSLFGFDPAGDYQRILRQQPGRRVNLADTAQSMLLTKAVGAVPHTGGKLFDTDHAFYRMIKAWLDRGAPDDPADVATVTRLEVFPQDIVLQGADTTQQITVRAHYSDGSDRDVTDLAVLITSNDVSATIDNAGVITAGKRGEAFVMARYDAHTVGTPVIVIPANDAKTPAYPDQLASANYIDEHINAKLRKMRIVPSDLCDDATYARRVYIDLVGQLPPIDELDAFVADKDPAKRAKLVDRLLERREYVDIWVMKWAERLQIQSGNANQGQMSPKAAVLYFEWLRKQIAGDVPMNDVVHDLIASKGGTFENPATNFYQAEQDTLRLSENVVQVFLGSRMQCAQCHNHPFDRWTMDDYYGFTAFFAQIGRKRGDDPREQVVFNRGSGDIKHPLDGRDMQPTYLGGQTAELQRGQDRRDVLADWLTSPTNRAFNRNLANFVWEHFFGRGITHPIDDVRISNPPVNGPLLDALADRLVQTDYNIKQLIREICASNAYQRSTRANDTNLADTTNFSHALPRRIRAEVLLDCISQVTQTRDDFRGLPLGARAVQIVDGKTSTYFLTTFGRATRETVCTCEVVMEPNLSQALHLINGNTTNDKIRQGKRVESLLNAGRDTGQVIDELYRAAFSRPPTPTERERLVTMVDSSEDKKQALEDVFWALLNAKEFIFNH